MTPRESRCADTAKRIAVTFHAPQTLFPHAEGRARNPSFETELTDRLNRGVTPSHRRGDGMQLTDRASCSYCSRPGNGIIGRQDRLVRLTKHPPAPHFVRRHATGEGLDNVAIRWRFAGISVVNSKSCAPHVRPHDRQAKRDLQGVLCEHDHYPTYPAERIRDARIESTRARGSA